jgi:serine/threonine protein kinase
MFLCELVCGLFYLHSEKVVHGELTPCKLLLDDDFHLHISGFATTSLLTDKIICSKKVGHANYAPPEVFERKDSPNSTFERRSKIDIYSLGFIICELFGNAKWARGLGRSEISRQARENIRPALPGGINRRLGELICRCWDSDPDKRPTIEEVLREMSSMRFQFVPDVDCASVVRRALAVGPSDLITASLPEYIPEFEPMPPPCSIGIDEADEDRPFATLISELIDYFQSAQLDSMWNPVDAWRSALSERETLKVRETECVDWNTIANFIVRYCREVLPALESSQVSTEAFNECRNEIESALHGGAQNLQSIIEAQTRTLHSLLRKLL